MILFINIDKWGKELLVICHNTQKNWSKFLSLYFVFSDLSTKTTITLQPEKKIFPLLSWKIAYSTHNKLYSIINYNIIRMENQTYYLTRVQPLTPKTPLRNFPRHIVLTGKLHLLKNLMGSCLLLLIFYRTRQPPQHLFSYLLYQPCSWKQEFKDEVKNGSYTIVHVVYTHRTWRTSFNYRSPKVLRLRVSCGK